MIRQRNLSELVSAIYLPDAHLYSLVVKNLLWTKEKKKSFVATSIGRRIKALLPDVHQRKPKPQMYLKSNVYNFFPHPQDDNYPYIQLGQISWEELFHISLQSLQSSDLIALFLTVPKATWNLQSALNLGYF